MPMRAAEWRDRLREFRTQDGTALADLAEETPVLLVFLRHFGCTFAREAIRDIATRRAVIEATGSRLVLVHMAHDALAAAMLTRYGLRDVRRVSDPDRRLYAAFDLARGTVGQVFGPGLWVRMFSAGVLAGHRIGRVVGDGMQMPGVFLVYRGQIIRSFRHKTIADRPDYVALASHGLTLGLQPAASVS
jgi:hypothetical protein